MLSMQMTAPTIFVTVLTQGVIECDAQNYFQQQRILFIYFIFFIFVKMWLMLVSPLLAKKFRAGSVQQGMGSLLCIAETDSSA